MNAEQEKHTRLHLAVDKNRLGEILQEDLMTLYKENHHTDLTMACNENHRIVQEMGYLEILLVDQEML